MPPVLIRDLKLASPLMSGEDVEGIRRKTHLYAGVSLAQMPKKTADRRRYGPALEQLVIRVQDDMAIPKTGVVDNRMLALLNKDFAAGRDRYSDWLIKKYAALHPARQVPALGPIYRGGRSLLLQDLTHETSGIDGYPAFDDGWRAGLAVIAPERLTVTQQSGSQGGDAFYARGDSTIEYWVGHLTRSPATGTVFAKGATMSQIAAIPPSQGGPHVHTGINAKPLTGFELLHHDNYTHGAPTVGEQLRKWANA